MTLQNSHCQSAARDTMTISAAGHQARSGRIDPNSQSNTLGVRRETAQCQATKTTAQAGSSGGRQHPAGGRPPCSISSRPHGTTILVHGIADAQEWKLRPRPTPRRG